MPPQVISIPPAVGATIKPAGGEFEFYVTATTNVCFGTANPAGSYPDLENQAFIWSIGTTHTFPIPDDIGAELPYNTSTPGTPCTTIDPTDTGKVIVVGSGMTPKPQTKSKPKAKKKAVKKTAARKGGSRPAAKRKAAPKKAAKKSKAKPKSKAKAKPKSKKKSAKKSRR